jgi:hypothetical protein
MGTDSTKKNNCPCCSKSSFATREDLVEHLMNRHQDEIDRKLDKEKTISPKQRAGYVATMPSLVNDEEE